MNKTITLIAFFYLYITGICSAQKALGTWYEHLPYSNARHVALGDNKIYCATSEGVFYYNLNDNTFNNRLSKINGLSDIGVSSMGYSPENKTLVLAYENANLDIIVDKNIYNIPDIKSKRMVGSKTINHVGFIDKKAILSCDFGIVVIDLERLEIENTLFASDNGDVTAVNQTAFDGTDIYAATNSGLFKGDFFYHNLIDFNFWKKIDFIPNPGAACKAVDISKNKLVIAQTSQGESPDNLFLIQGNTYTEISNDLHGINKFKFCHNKLFALNDSKIYQYNENGTAKTDISDYLYGWTSPKDIVCDKEGTFWIADNIFGLVKKLPGSSGLNIHPNGPQFSSVSEIEIVNNILWVAGDTHEYKYKTHGTYIMKNEKWTNINFITPQAIEMKNISNIAVDPSNPNHAYGASFGFGVYEFENNKAVKLYNAENSKLKQKIEGVGGLEVSDVKYGKNGELWIICSGLKEPVYTLIDDEIKPFPLGFNGFSTVSEIGHLLVTQNNNKWFARKDKGLFVFNDNGDYTAFPIKDSDGNTETNNIYCLAEDLEGNVWVGTDIGIFVFYGTDYIIENHGSIASRINTFIDGELGYLLSTEKVNSIAVDAANRKWIATEKSGVFLMSEDGTKEIRHFTIDNSPLPTNLVLAIEINDNTGEVFFGTSRGIVSFVADAIASNNNFGDVYAYPNPVRPDFDGDIVITGLVKDATIKITDISGNLVFETTSLGGQALWDGNNFNGQRAHTGVYLVFCSNEEGTESIVAKLLFVN